MGRCDPKATGTTVASTTDPSSAERVKSTIVPDGLEGVVNANCASKGPNWPFEPPMKKPSPSFRPAPAPSSRTSQLTWASKAVLVPVTRTGECTRLPGSGLTRSMVRVRAPVTYQLPPDSATVTEVTEVTDGRSLRARTSTTRAL